MGNGFRTIEAVFTGHAGRLFRLARKILRSETDADDVVQEVFLGLTSAPNLVEDIEDVGPWLYSVVKRRCVDLVRREDATRRREKKHRREDGHDSQIDAETKEAIVKALRELPKDLRLVFTANVIDGITFRELSDATGIPQGTLLSRKQKALEELRKKLATKGIFKGE